MNDVSMGLSYEASLISRYASVGSRLGKAVAPKPRRVALLAPAAPVMVEAPQNQPLSIAKCIEAYADGSTPSWKVVMAEVAKKYNVSMLDITSPRRDMPTVMARQEFCYRLRHETRMTLPQIAKRIGNRDHTTVLHSIRKHAARLAGNTYARKVVNPGSGHAVVWTADKLQRAMDMRFNLGKKYKEIAAAIGGVSGAAVARRLDRVRQAQKRAAAYATELER